MLASVYSYRVMVKSVSSCCVRGRRVLSNPVTYIDLFNYYYYHLVYQLGTGGHTQKAEPLQGAYP